MIQLNKKILIVLLGLISILGFASSEKDNPFRKVAREVRPVVVQIDTVYTTKVPTMKSPYDFFFNTPQDNEDKKDEPGYREFKSSGLGSGVVVETDGDKKYVLTNHHVIKNAEELSVHFSDGKKYEAKLVGSDPRKDLALLVFETEDNIPKAKLGDSDDLYIGDWAIAIGSPLGYESTVTLGIISAIGRSNAGSQMIADFTDYIQTDAAINRGNSGGALVNIDGEVIGINTWIASGSGGNIGLGFAIPINNAKTVIRQLIDKGSVEYGWLGVSMGSILPEIKEELDNKGQEGAFIYSIFNNSPAERSGIKPGDIVISVDNKTIKDNNDLLKAVGNLPAGKKSVFRVIRDNQIINVNVFPETRDEDSGKGSLWPGVTVVPLTDKIVEEMNKVNNKKISKRTKGVMVAAVAENSVSKLTGVLPGDVIIDVDGEKVRSINDFYRYIGNSGEEITLKLIRKGQKIKLILLNE